MKGQEVRTEKYCEDGIYRIDFRAELHHEPLSDQTDSCFSEKNHHFGKGSVRQSHRSRTLLSQSAAEGSLGCPFDDLDAPYLCFGMSYGISKQEYQGSPATDRISVCSRLFSWRKSFVFEEGISGIFQNAGIFFFDPVDRSSCVRTGSDDDTQTV